MKLTAKDLYELGIIEKVIKENDFATTALDIKKEITAAVLELKTKTKEEIVEERYQKFRKISGFKQI